VLPVNTKDLKKWIDDDLNYGGLSYKQILRQYMDSDNELMVRLLLEEYPLTPELKQEATNYIIMKQFGHKYNMNRKRAK
jgi:hypothetical protein